MGHDMAHSSFEAQTKRHCIGHLTARWTGRRQQMLKNCRYRSACTRWRVSLIHEFKNATSEAGQLGCLSFNMVSLLTHYRQTNLFKRMRANLNSTKVQRTRDHRFCSGMEEKEAIESSNNKRLRQPPSVPFLWEEKPGVAQKDWRPKVSSVAPVLPRPAKLVASVPFLWEEKPGTPLSRFTKPSMELAILNPPANLGALSLPLIPAQGDDNQYRVNTYWGQRDGRDKPEIFDLDLLSYEAGDSLSSAPSLMANCVVPSTAISTAVPMQKTSPTEDINDHTVTPSSPTSESDSSTSSYATGFSSLVGDSFLECLFPIHPPHSGFLGKAAYPSKGPLSSLELHNRDIHHEPGANAVVRRPRTLGELIMMSRRMSLQRKAVQRRKERLSMEFINKKALGCCFFGISNKLIEGLQRKNLQARLKLF